MEGYCCSDFRLSRARGTMKPYATPEIPQRRHRIIRYSFAPFGIPKHRATPRTAAAVGRSNPDMIGYLNTTRPHPRNGNRDHDDSPAPFPTAMIRPSPLSSTPGVGKDVPKALVGKQIPAALDGGSANGRRARSFSAGGTERPATGMHRSSPRGTVARAA